MSRHVSNRTRISRQSKSMTKNQFLALVTALISPIVFLSFATSTSASPQRISLQSLSERRLDFSGGSDTSNEQISEISQIEKKEKTKPRSSLSAPFLLNQVAKEEASIKNDGSMISESSSDEAQEERSSKQILAGGAMIKEAKTRSAPSDVSPIYQTCVATMSNRLMNDSNDIESDESGSIEESSSRNSADLAKLWWVNVWTQQLSVEAERTTDIVSDDSTLEDESEVGSTDYELEEVVEETLLDELEVVEDTESNLIEAPEKPATTENDSDSEAETAQVLSEERVYEDFISSGLWLPIDNLLTLGLARKYESMRLSRRLRSTRKFASKVTGFHGLLSGKPFPYKQSNTSFTTTEDDNVEGTGFQRRIAAIDEARKGVERAVALESRPLRRIPFLKRRGRRKEVLKIDENGIEKEERMDQNISATESALEINEKEDSLRMERVKEIDRLIAEGQERLQELICLKDVLQKRPNPLFNYTTENIESKKNDETEKTKTPFGIQASREFKFPPDDLVEEYLEMAFSSRRLVKMNHTSLWKDAEEEDEDEERIGDDLLTPSADAHKLYEDSQSRRKKGESNRSRNGGGGSWLLRQSIGKGPSLGEKIGEAAETAAYKAVCGAVMSFLAHALSSLHGINVMKHSDIRIVLEQSPDLPPVGEGVIPGSSNNYAQEALKTVMRKKARKGKKRSKLRPSEDSFVQRDAVTEMLLSHVQISAPLLKLFPLAWQRALLGNIITLSTSVMSDLFDGLQFQILGNRLSFAFKPITEEDMINHLGLAGGGFNHRRVRPEDFEAAVRATAEDVGEELKFLDRWHERALGSGVLRVQIANLIARIVLTLTDEVLSGARMDLWSAQAGGPRMLAGLEYRNQPN